MGRDAGAEARSPASCREEEGTPQHALLITRHAPSKLHAGNLVYLDHMITVTARYTRKLTVLVIGDRFPNDDFVIRDPDRENVEYVIPYATRLGKYLVLSDPAAVLKTLLRRALAWLPGPVRRRVSEYYASTLAPRARFHFLNARIAAPQAAATAWECIRAIRPGCVIIDTLDFIGILREPGPKPFRSFVLCHDLLSQRLRSAADRRLKADMRPLTLEQEMQLLALADCVIAIQRQEAELIRARLARPVIYLPYVPPRPVAPSARGARRGESLLFVGSAGAPNLTAITWFLEAIWPAIRRQQPDASLDVVGNICEYVSPGAEAVRLRGRVPSLEPFYARGPVVVVPLRFGSGLKIKLVEALGAGCACVTTGVGAQGLEEGIGRAFLLADDPAEFAACVVRLLRDPDLRGRLEAAARRFVEELDQARALASYRRALRRTPLAPETP